MGRIDKDVAARGHMKKEETQELTDVQEREQDIKAIQDYSKFVPLKDLNTPEEVAEWLNEDDWEPDKPGKAKDENIETLLEELGQATQSLPKKEVSQRDLAKMIQNNEW